MQEHYGRRYFSGEEESGYSRGVYGRGLIWKVKFLVAALHTRYELLKGNTSPSILDIGGANGSQAVDFNRVGFKSTVLDISDWAREDSRIPNRHIQGNALALPFKDNSFDRIYCNDLMEHFTLGEMNDFFRETRRILKPGGVGILVPVTDLEARRKGETDVDNKRKGHISLLPEETWRKLIQAAGFTIRKSSLLTEIFHQVGRTYILHKAWIPTARDGIFIIEKPIQE